jgi:hypothetical protein
MASTTLPVRAAIIGLSSTAVTSWASTAHLPGLLSSTGRSKITIKALLNSSVEAAKAAIETYKLPSDTKAYGLPETLAADPDIDLVICNTRVDKHYETIIPSVRAGKDVYVEWPIAAKKEHIDELVETARKNGSRIAVGLQGRWTPPVTKLRELLNGGSGKLGKVLSAEVRAYGGTNDREILPTGLKYFAQKEVGGNPIVIGFGHGKHRNVRINVIADMLMLKQCSTSCFLSLASSIPHLSMQGLSFSDPTFVFEILQPTKSSSTSLQMFLICSLCMVLSPRPHSQSLAQHCLSCSGADNHFQAHLLSSGPSTASVEKSDSYLRLELRYKLVQVTSR